MAGSRDAAQRHAAAGEALTPRAFVFSHGGRHGAWAWQFVLAELEQRGHEAVAVDLPIEDETAGAERCADVLAEAAHGFGRPVTVVGHSMSGCVIPLVPDRAPVEELAFVCTPLPVPGLSLWEQMEREPDTDVLIRETLQPLRDGHARGEQSADSKAHAIHTYYHDLPDELAQWAAEQLRPQKARVTDEPSPFRRWPDVRLRYILGTLDRIVNPEWSRREVPRRLGVVPIELETGNSPFLARPRELVDALLAPA